mgnify:CR=1 FL=1
MWYVCTSIKSILHTRFNWELSLELYFTFNYIGSLLQPSQLRPSCVCINNQEIFATELVFCKGKRVVIPVKNHDQKTISNRSMLITASIFTSFCTLYTFFEKPNSNNTKEIIDNSKKEEEDTAAGVRPLL